MYQIPSRTLFEALFQGVWEKRENNCVFFFLFMNVFFVNNKKTKTFFFKFVIGSYDYEISNIKRVFEFVFIYFYTAPGVHAERSICNPVLAYGGNLKKCTIFRNRTLSQVIYFYWYGLVDQGYHAGLHGVKISICFLLQNGCYVLFCTYPFNQFLSDRIRTCVPHNPRRQMPHIVTNVLNTRLQRPQVILQCQSVKIIHTTHF